MLVEPTTEAIAAGISSCLSDNEYRKLLGNQAAELAQQNYSYTNYLSRVEKVYNFIQPQTNPNGHLAKPLE